MIRVTKWPAYAVVGLLAASLALMAATRVPPAAAAGATKPAAAKPTSSALEQLLKQSKLDYIPKEGSFLVPVTIDGETTLVSMEQRGIGEDPKLRLVYLFTQVLEVSTEAKLPQAMLKKMAEMNNNLVVGKLGLDENGVWYCSSFWLSRAESDTLAAELVFAHMTRKDARKQLVPFLQE